MVTITVIFAMLPSSKAFDAGRTLTRQRGAKLHVNILNRRIEIDEIDLSMSNERGGQAFVEETTYRRLDHLNVIHHTDQDANYVSDSLVDSSSPPHVLRQSYSSLPSSNVIATSKRRRLQQEPAVVDGSGGMGANKDDPNAPVDGQETDPNMNGMCIATF